MAVSIIKTSMGTLFSHQHGENYCIDGTVRAFLEKSNP